MIPEMLGMGGGSMQRDDAGGGSLGGFQDEDGSLHL